jgi:ABC-2 type transport system ATP-binding protein
MENILEVKGLNKDLFTFKIEDVSFELKYGYIMGFIGPNGSGKTTTIKLIMNLLKKDSGNIKIFGKDHVKFEKEIKDRIGFVYDGSYFYENLSMRNMKEVIAPFYSKWDEELFKGYMRDFALDPGRKIKKLSKGEKMKYSIALAFSHNADLIIMDEPTAGLDPIMRRELLDILYEIIQDNKKAVFFSTHITTDLEKIADYITFINKGKIEFSKSIEEVGDSFYIVKGDTKALDSIDRSNFIGTRITNLGFESLARKVDGIRDIYGERVVIEKPSLEDIMYYHVKGDKYVKSI